MTPVEALRLALSKEMEAMQLYQELSLANPAVKDTFLFLINEEAKHKKLIEERLFELRR
jgi:rubrerythrin